MIVLTKFVRVRTYVHRNGEPIWVNPKFIVTMERRNSDVLTDESEKPPLKERPREDYTLLTFAVGHSDDYLTEQVHEAPNLIRDMIGGGK